MAIEATEQRSFDRQAGPPVVADADVDLRRATLDRIGHLPVNPRPLLAVLQAPADEPAAVAAAIDSDPSLAARLLSVVNSAAFGVTHPIDDVRRAVLHLGPARARNLALAFGLRALHESTDLDETWQDQLWIASLRKAAAAKLAGKIIQPSSADKVCVLGMIQDLALPLLVQLDLPGYLQRIVPAPQAQWCELERKRFGIDHAELGAHLLDQWGASVDLQRALRGHHRPPALPAVECARESAEVGDALTTLPLYLASLLPHLGEEISGMQRDWLTALHGQFLTPVYATPDAYIAVAHERAARLHAKPAPSVVDRHRLARDVAAVVAEDSAQMVVQLTRMENSLCQQREDLDNLRFQAFTDPLTRLLNRRGFADLAARRLETAATRRLGVCLMVLDLDDFKPINDRFGHEAGDRMLRGLARLLRRSLDRNDLVGRIGGDEFVVLLAGVDESQARQVVDRLVATCHDQPLRVARAGDTQARVQFSLGAVHVSAANEKLNIEELLHLADAAMYQSKRQGKAGLLFQRYAELRPTEGTERA